MNFAENIKQAFDSLVNNKLRSILTMLGIVMGVFSVIAIMAIGNAAKSYMNSEFEKMGTNTIMIQYKTSNIMENDWLVYEDLDLIKNAVSGVKNISAASTNQGEIKINNKTKDANVYGVTSQYSSFQAINIAAGRFISDIDVSERRKVVFVNDTFAKKYFNSVDVIGEEIELRNTSGNVIKLKIIGVQSTEGELFASMMSGDEFPANIYIPLPTFQYFYDQKMIQSIDIAVEDKNDLKSIGEKVVKLLEFKNKNEDKYYALSVEDIQKSVGGILNVISLVLLVIAVITLVVGGIGIVNILLVSVTERIREIGIRKSLGAQKKDIVLQFLTESILMTGFSGLIGILLGIASGSIISALIKIPPVVDFNIVILAFMGSVVLGIIFGVYPAKRAADLDPIEALRYE